MRIRINKISVITVVFNDFNNITRTLDSIAKQKKKFNIEYIVIDGNSDDGTKELLQKKRDIIDKLISEKDEGIYDAMNKGIKIASGEVIALLHSGDIYFKNSILSEIAEIFNNKNCDVIYSDCIIYNYNKNKIFRYYFSKIFSKKLMLLGWMPPHPGCFIASYIFRNRKYSTNYKIASDFEFLFSLSKDEKIKWTRYKNISVILDNRGVSSQLKNKFLINKELKDILRSNGKNFFSKIIFLRYFIRIFELIYKPKILIK